MNKKIIIPGHKKLVQDYIIKNKSNMSWAEIANNLNTMLGYEFTESAYRKMQRDNYSEEKLNLLAKQRTNLALERKVVQIEKYQNKESVDKIFIAERLTETLRNHLVSTNFNPTPKHIKAFAKPTDNDVYMVTITDFHYTGTQLWKFDVITKKTLELVKEKNIKTLIINELGDSIEGTIHLSGFVQLKKGADKLITEYALRFIQFVNEISQYCKVVVNALSSSNHSETRPLNSKRGEWPLEDRAFVLTTLLDELTKHNKNITVHTGARIVFTMLGFKMLLLHGHQVRTVKSYLQEFIMANNVMLDYLIMGHYHASNVQTVAQGARKKGKLHNKKVIIEPGAVGTNPYSAANNWTCYPAFGFDKFNEKYGHIYHMDIYIDKSELNKK